MSGLILCGRRTTNPYYIEEAGINIYSVEELCYYLYNNTYMVGRDFFTEELASFISDELELPSLGQRIKQKLACKADLASMVMDIMTSTSYYSHDECKGIEETIKKLGSMSKPERMKARADILIERKRYVSAIEAYKEILGNRDEQYNSSFVASIWNNMGVVYAKQFLFVDALKCFRLACDIDRKEEYFKNMISAAMFSKDEELLDDVVAQYQVTDGMLEEYINKVESLKKEIIKEKEFVELTDSFKYNGRVGLATFNDNVCHVLDSWKEEYRQMNT